MKRKIIALICAAGVACSLSLSTAAVTKSALYRSAKSNIKVASTRETVREKNVTLQQAEEIALSEVGGGEIIKAKFDTKKKTGFSTYDITVLYETFEYKVKIDANTGEIIKSVSDYVSVEVTREQAEEIALDKVGGGEVVSIKLNTKKKTGISTYKVKILKNTVNYQIKVDAGTGEIVMYKVKK